MPSTRLRQLGLALAVDIAVVAGLAPGAAPGPHGRAAGSADATVVGVAGELLPSIAADLDLPRVVALVEVDLDALIELSSEGRSATPIGTLPAATQDLSLVVSVDVPAGEVLAAIVEGAGALLEDARLVDDYRGSGVEEGQQVADLRPPLPRARPHADRGGGLRREARRPRPRARRSPVTERRPSASSGDRTQQFATARKISLGSCS